MRDKPVLIPTGIVLYESVGRASVLLYLNPYNYNA